MHLRLLTLFAALLQPDCVLTFQSTTLPTAAAARRSSAELRGGRGGPVFMGRKFENNKVKMAKTAAAYTKKASLVGKKIQVAVKEGGPDPDVNRNLAMVIKEAMTLNVKREIVDRNIKKAMGGDSTDFKELTYEIYARGGVGIIVNALSDNNNRAFTDIGTVAKKMTWSMAAKGSVAHNFERKGRITLNSEIDEDQLIELAIEADVDDVELREPDMDLRHDGEEVRAAVLTEVSSLVTMQGALQAAGFECVGAIVNEPIDGTLISLSEEELKANLEGLDKLEELGDVDSVEHNINFGED